jgi:hypothetical protein
VTARSRRPPRGRRGRRGPVVEALRADPADVDTAVERVFACDDETVYRFERDPDAACVCERITALDCPVADVAVAEGRLELTLHVPDPVVVDHGRPTARQAEVPATAHEMGDLEYPREANATEVAAPLDTGPSTLAEHLAAVESKLVGQTLDEGASRSRSRRNSRSQTPRSALSSPYAASTPRTHASSANRACWNRSTAGERAAGSRPAR